MKKRNVALALGLCLSVGLTFGLAACGDDPAPAAPDPFETDAAKFAAVPLTEDTHYLAGNFKAYGEQWGDNATKKSPVTAYRFEKHSDNNTMFRLTVSLYEGDMFKIRYEGLGWGDGPNEGSVPAEFLKTDKANGIGPEEGTGMGGRNFQVYADGKYEIRLIMKDDRTMGQSVTYVKVGEADKLPVAVTGVTLNKAATSLQVGGEETLTATVKPDNADDKTVTWTTSDATVATVTNAGKVTAVAAGTATITATAGTKSATCTVTVVDNLVPVTGVTIDKQTSDVTDLHVGDSVVVNATIAPTDATTQTVTWDRQFGDSPAYSAVVDTTDGNKLTIKAIAPGTGTVKATADEKESATLNISVVQDYYIRGNSKNDNIAGWDMITDYANIPEAVRFAHSSSEGTNTWEATLDLYKNDSMKFAYLGEGNGNDWGLGNKYLAAADTTNEINNYVNVPEGTPTSDANINISKSGSYKVTIVKTATATTISFKRLGDPTVAKTYESVAVGVWGAHQGANGWAGPGEGEWAVAKAENTTPWTVELTSTFGHERDDLSYSEDATQNHAKEWQFRLFNNATDVTGNASAYSNNFVVNWAADQDETVKGYFKYIGETKNYLCTNQGVYKMTLVFDAEGNIESLKIVRTGDVPAAEPETPASGD